LKIERHQQEEKAKRDGLNIQLAQLVDKARQYARVLKDFQEVYLEIFYLFIIQKFFRFRQYEKMNLSFQSRKKSEKEKKKICYIFFK